LVDNLTGKTMVLHKNALSVDNPTGNTIVLHENPNLVDNPTGKTEMTIEDGRHITKNRTTFMSSCFCGHCRA
jgi:hypothetical protein